MKEATFTENKIRELSYEFKQRRKYLNLSQLQLAKLAHLSQSIITKFENNKIDPTLSTILKIEKALEEKESISQKKVADIMIKDITSTSLTTSLLEALTIMRSQNFSQLLVMEKLIVKGIITEKRILDFLLEGFDLKEHKVKEVLEISPVIIPKEYSLIDLKYFFQNKKTLCVLVGSQTSIQGIVTKSDLFR